VSSSCTFEELAARVAEMLKAGASQEQIDRFLERLSPAYRAEVVAAARDVLAHDAARRR
jgi:fatty acid-binding protein DegV